MLVKSGRHLRNAHGFAPLRSCNACNLPCHIPSSFCHAVAMAPLVAPLVAPSHAVVDDAADGTTEFAFKATFDVMKARQGTRRSVFAYIMQRPGTAVYLLTLVWLGGCACVSEVRYSSTEETWPIFIPTSYAVALLFFHVLPTNSLVIFIEHLAMVNASAVGVALLIDANPDVWDLSFSDHDPALYTAFLVLFRLYMLYIFYVNLVIMPFIQRRLAALGSAAWAIEPIAGQPGQFTYRRAVRWWEPWWVFRGGRDFWWFVRGRLFGGEGKSIKSFKYVGELDMQGRPHGRGRWSDTHRFGVRQRRCVERALLPTLLTPIASSSYVPQSALKSTDPLLHHIQSPRTCRLRSTSRVCGSTASQLGHS